MNRFCIFAMIASFVVFGFFPLGSAQGAKKSAQDAKKPAERAEGFEPLHTITMDAECTTSLVFSPDGKTLAAADYHGKIRFWDVATGKPLKTVFTHSTPERANWATTIAFSPDGRLLASSRQGEEGGLRLWDLQAEREIARLEKGLWHASSVAFDPTGKTLGVIDISQIVLFDVTKKAVIHKIPHKEGGLSALWLAFSPDGKKLVQTGATSPRLHIWDCVKGIEERVITASGSTYAVHWSKDGKSLIAVGPYSNGYSEISYWHADKGTHYKRLDMTMRSGGIPLPTLTLAFSPDEKYLAMGDPQKMLEIWNTDTGQSVAFNRRWLPAFSPDGKMFACGRFVADVQRIEIWEFSKLQKLVD
jgi:WD40 repeat protein